MHRATQTIAAHAPYPGSPVIVVDTAGSATCATQEGGFSRYNESTARLCAELAVQAVHDGIDSVAIITPYVEQSRRIRRLLPLSFKPLIGLQIPPGHIGKYPLHIVDQLDTVSRLVR